MLSLPVLFQTTLATPTLTPVSPLRPLCSDLSALCVALLPAFVSCVFSIACSLFCRSLPLPKNSTPLKSTKSSLFSQNTRVGVSRIPTLSAVFTRHRSATSHVLISPRPLEAPPTSLPAPDPSEQTAQPQTNANTRPPPQTTH